MLALLMVFGTVNSWALTADLSTDYELAGYKAKAFYDFTANADGVLPESGDLRFRSGYGLYNYGSGGRSGDVSISVSEGDLVVCQFADTQNRGVTINSISGCTKSTTLNDGSHIFFTADSELSTLTFNVGRAGCVVSVLIMEVDASAATADYTVNYVCDGSVVKTVSATGAVDGEVLTDASFFADDVKYIRKDGEPESFAIAAEGNTFNVNVRLAATYAYTLADNFGTTIATGSGFEGEKATVGYPRYLLADGKFYEAGKTNNEYRKSITLDVDNATASVDYAEKQGVNSVFFCEGENIEGMTVSTNGNIPVRASNAQAATADEDLLITTLAPGKYIFHVGIFTSKSSYGENTVNFGIGSETFSAAFANVNLCEVASGEFELNASTEIKYLGTTSWADAQFDYIWIEKTGDVEPAFDPATAIVNADFNPEADPIGWEKVHPEQYYDLGMGLIGTYQVRGEHPAATVDETHLATEFAAGLECRWQTNYAAFTQTTTELLAGAYKLTFDVENTNATTTKANYENRFNVTVGENVYNDESTEWMNGKSAWTTHTIIFTLTEASPITISLGYGTGANNFGVGNTPALFVSHFKLEAIDAIGIALTKLKAAIDAAQAQTATYTIGEVLFTYAASEITPLTEAITTAQAAYNAAESVEAVEAATTTLNAFVAAFAPVMNKPAADKEYVITNKNAELALSIGNGAVKIETEGVVKFTEVEGGWVLSNNLETPEYVFKTKTTGNTWTLSTTANKDEAYVVNFNLADGAYTIQGANGLFGTDNTAAGSTVYANKAQSNNGLWTIAEYVAPEPVKTDYTDYIVNADLTNTETKGWDETGTKNIDGSGIVKVGNASAFDFKQTIENLPAGKYKVTAQAAYRYGDSEQAEYEAMQTENTITKFVQLYATVGTKTVSTLVQNRYDGASDTDLASEGAVLVNEKYVPNSSNAVKAWFAAGKYVNELEFNLPADGAVTIGINRVGTPTSDYTVIGPWTLTRLGDAEEEPEPEIINPGDDVTKFIVNNSFETGNTSGWTVGSSSDTGVRENSNTTYTTEGCDGNYLFNTWWQGIPITQTITGLPNGLYELKALMANDAITAGNKPCLYLLANGEHSEAFSSATAGTFAEGTMQFYVTDGTATIGAVGGNADGSFTEAGYYWYKADNFRLKYVEALPNIDDIEIPEGKMSNAAAQAITAAQDASDVVALLEAVKNARVSIEAYAHLKSVLDELDEIAANTNVYTNAAKETFDQTVNTAKKSYDEGTMNDADAKAFNYGSRLEGIVPSLLLSAFTSNSAGIPYINTWSVEGNNDGTNFFTPFFEYWVGDGDSLGENTLTATMNGVEPGNYEVKAWVRVRIKNGAEAPAAGITFQANDGEAVNAADGAQIGESQFYLKEVVATGTVAEDGVLNIKFNVASENNISWLSFKNVWFEKTEVPAVYEGFVAVSAAMAQAPATPLATTATEEQTVTIAKGAEENQVNITFTGFHMSPMPSTTGEFTLTATATVAEDGSITYTSEPQTISIKMGMITATYTATVEGAQVNAEATPVLVLSVKQATIFTVVFAETVDAADAKMADVLKEINTATGINGMKSNAIEGTIYNLNGQKVEKTKKGLYIINGKKVVIK